jgi:hypothetical protein
MVSQYSPKHRFTHDTGPTFHRLQNRALLLFRRTMSRSSQSLKGVIR